MMLAELQHAMRDWLTDAAEDAAIRLGGVAVAPGLRVYQNNFRASLAACLTESFARTRDWIGGEEFHDAIVAHVERVPPSSWTLDAYPRDFPETLAMLYPADPEVAELAWIELALAEAFVAPDAEPLTADALEGVDWDCATLALTPTLALAPAATNAAAILTALSEAREPPAVAWPDDPAAVCVWRDGEAPCFRAIDAVEHRALTAVCAGEPFAALCEALVDALGAEAGVQRAGALLGRWLADGLIVAIGGADRQPAYVPAISAE